MPIARFKMPDGRIARFQVYEGTTPEQAQTIMEAHFSTPQAQYEGRNINDMSGVSKFLVGVGNSAMDFGRGAAQIYGNPQGESFGSQKDIEKSKALREELNKSGAGKAGDIVGNVAPVMMTGGASLPATLASGLAYGALQPTEGNNKLERGKNMLISAGSGAAGVGIGKVLSKTPEAAAWLIGNLGTHTGGESIKQAAKAGFEGGTKGQSFLANLRGDVPATDVLGDMKGALANMRTDRGAAYRQGMAGVNADRTVLNFQPIRQAVDDAFNIGISSGGHVMNKQASGVQKEINKAVTTWQRGNPAIDHTAQGLDELKQTIGNIRDNTDFGTPARVVADRVYHSVRDQIVKQAPDYAKTMKSYEEATKLTKEIERTLGLGDKTAADTAMRKLLSLTRNNANTNYGNRLTLAQQLERNGAPNIMSDISGQALSAKTPRGLGGLLASGAAGYGLATLNPAIIPLLAAQSPRLMGEAAYLVGKGGQKANKLTSALNRNAGNIGIATNQQVNK